MFPLQGPVLSESLHELVNLLCVHFIEVVFKLRLPEVDSEPRSHVGLVVGPQGTELHPRAQLSIGGRLVGLLEFLVDDGVVDVFLRHVVEQVGSVLERDVVRCFVVHVGKQ